MKKALFTLFCICFTLSVFYTNSISLVYADFDYVRITFIFQDKQFIYDSRLYENVQSVYFKSKLQKRGINDYASRANQLRDVLLLGFEPYIALNYCLVGIDKVLDRMQSEIECSPVDATYNFKPTEPHFSFSKEKIGYKIDFFELANQIKEGLQRSNDFTIHLTPTKLMPNVIYDDIKEYNSLRTEFSTSFLPNENRKHNIELALLKFNGLILEPNKEYSFNKITGRREESNGYKDAKIIVGGKYVDGTGGGVCQVSTTLYNALLLAGVEICEVHNHTLTSSYVKLGFDAMVSYGFADLRWKNTFNFPLFLITEVKNNQVLVQVWGKSDKHIRYERVCEIEDFTLPPQDEVIVDYDGKFIDIVEFDDECEYVQLPHKGYKVRSILEKYENEKLVERKLLRRIRYQPCAGIRVIGAKKRVDCEICDENVFRII